MTSIWNFRCFTPNLGCGLNCVHLKSTCWGLNPQHGSIWTKKVIMLNVVIRVGPSSNGIGVLIWDTRVRTQKLVRELSPDLKDCAGTQTSDFQPLHQMRSKCLWFKLPCLWNMLQLPELTNAGTKALLHGFSIIFQEFKPCKLMEDYVLICSDLYLELFSLSYNHISNGSA